jgi:hypothetical protein
MRTNERADDLDSFCLLTYQLLFVTNQLLSANKFIKTFAASVAKLIVIQ